MPKLHEQACYYLLIIWPTVQVVDNIDAACVCFISVNCRRGLAEAKGSTIFRIPMACHGNFGPAKKNGQEDQNSRKNGPPGPFSPEKFGPDLE